MGMSKLPDIATEIMIEFFWTLKMLIVTLMPLAVSVYPSILTYSYWRWSSHALKQLDLPLIH